MKFDFHNQMMARTDSTTLSFKTITVCQGYQGFLFEIPNTIIFIVNCSRANTHPILMRRNGRMERDDILSSDRRIVAIK